jgi:hypothetical protein
MAMVKGKWVEPRKMTDCVIIRIGRVITNGKGPEPIPVATAEQLSKEFDDDPVAAEARYENGVIVSAVVAGIAKPLDDNYSTLNTSGKTQIRAELWGFSETMKLARGDKIEIRSNSMRRKDNEVIVNIRMLHRLD